MAGGTLDQIGQIRAKVKAFLAEEKNRNIATAGILAFAVVFYLVLFIVPQAGTLGRDSRELKTLNNQLDVAQRRLRQFNKLQKRLNELEAEQSDYSKKIPAEEEIPALLKGIAGIAEETKVKILSITPYPGKDGKNGKGQKNVYYREVPIFMSAQTGYHQLGNFVNKLEQGFRFINIEELNIKTNKSSPWKHNVSMVMKTYVTVE